jgi:hypothetical protein
MEIIVASLLTCFLNKTVIYIKPNQEQIIYTENTIDK